MHIQCFQEPGPLLQNRSENRNRNLRYGAPFHQGMETNIPRLEQWILPLAYNPYSLSRPGP